MAFPDKKIMTFGDLQWLVDNENFYSKGAFTPSLKGVTKLELIDTLQVADINPLAGFYIDNQLPPRDAFVQRGTVWIGDENDWICVDGSGPINTAPTTPGTPTLVTREETSLTIQWTASTDAEGNLVGYMVWGKKTVDSDYTPIVVGNVLTYTIENLSVGTSYDIFIVAYDTEPLYSGPSGILTVSTLSASIPLSLSIEDLTSDPIEWANKVVVHGDNTTQYTWKVDISVGGTIVNEEEWTYYDVNNTNDIKGTDSPTLPITLTGSIGTIGVTEKDEALYFWRDHEDGWAKATFTLLTATGYTVMPDPITVNIGERPIPDITVRVEYTTGSYHYVYVKARSGDILNGHVHIENGGLVSPDNGWNYYEYGTDLLWRNKLVRGINNPTLPGNFGLTSWFGNTSETMKIRFWNSRVDGGFSSWTTGAYFEITSSSMGSDLPERVYINLPG